MNENLFSEYQPYIFLAVGLIVLAVSLLFESKKSRLKETGIAVDGIVFSQESANTTIGSSTGSYTSVKDKVRVRFVTKNEEWITGVIEQDIQFFYTGQYKDGDTVQVYYDKDNPSNFYVDTKQSEIIGRLIIGGIGTIFTLIGLYQLFVS